MDRKQTSEEEKLNPGYAAVRSVLRIVGPVVLCVGLLFVAIGLIDFFSSFGNAGIPTKFWCLFAGMPLTFFGLTITNAAYMGAVACYVPAGYSPVAKDACGVSMSTEKDCSACEAPNDRDSKFCDHCGSSF